VHFLFRARLRAAAIEVLKPLQQLLLLSAIIRLIEKHPATSPRLQQVRETLAHQRASARIAKLARLVKPMLAMQMEFAAAIGYALLLPTQLCFAIEAWRRSHGPSLRAWLAAIGDFESLCSLAGYAYEHPADPFPVITSVGPTFEATGIGHPLIPDTGCVRNDLHLGGASASLLLLSGSNMSGKSTLPRAIGANAVLALAGAPVRAQSLRLSPLQLAASIRINDSLLDGRSRFYTEVARLRDVLDLTVQDLPVLFLLDELLHGTNSRDRLAGAEAVLIALVKRGAIGVCSTHDLALTEIVSKLPDKAHNAHFADTLTKSGLQFDFKLKQGVIQHSNAIDLMRALGLPL
jgi:DNA mismatch repair ATPase MutS